MRVYRLTKQKYANDLSGAGASISGGRWNRQGLPVLYTGGNTEIALLEVLVNIPPLFIPSLHLVTIEFPTESIDEINVKDLPPDWYQKPAPGYLKDLCENWVDACETIALKVPSSVVHTACNYILNPRHPEYKRVKCVDIKPFRFDMRLKR